jgi:hypothetical protein
MKYTFLSIGIKDKINLWRGNNGEQWWMMTGKNCATT